MTRTAQMSLPPADAPSAVVRVERAATPQYDGRRRPFRQWAADAAAAYVGGILVGAPIGLLAVWITDVQFALTGAILVAVATLLVVRRVRRRRGRVASSPGAPSHLSGSVQSVPDSNT